MSTRTIKEFAKRRRRRDNVYGKPPEPQRCSIQITDTTARKQQYICKLTVYGDPLKIKEVVHTAISVYIKERQ